MCSCEYYKTAGVKRTKILTLRNICFFMEWHILKHLDPNISHADSISITFKYQKHDEQNDMITQHWTGYPILCPIWQWGTIIQCIHTYPGSCDNTLINMILFSQKNKLQQLTNNMMLSKLWAAATALGKDELGFEVDELRIHSICSGAAMSMYLTGIPVFTIMLIGCWSSNAFLWYIQKQVQEFCAGVSLKMITADSFFTIAEASHEDPQVSSHYHNFMARNHCGHDAQLDSDHPAFALWS